MMAMDWQTLKKEVYIDDYEGRGIYIKDVSIEDWEKWIDFVNKNYPVSFHNGDSGLKQNQIDKRSALDYLRRETLVESHAVILIGSIEIHEGFYCEKEIYQGFDPLQVNALEDHQNLMDYLSAISNLLDKPVVIEEDLPIEEPFIKVFKDVVVFRQFDKHLFLSTINRTKNILNCIASILR